MQADVNGQNNSRMVLLLIAGIPVTMVLAATWLWFFVARGDIDLVSALGTANQGTLVQPPRQLAGVVQAEGAALVFAGSDPKWTLLVANAGAECGHPCEEQLYLTRQIHFAMGKQFNRLQRMYVADHAIAATELTVPSLSDAHPLPDNFASYLAQEQQGLISLHVGEQDFQRLFMEQLEQPDTWYLVDPAGWIMRRNRAQSPASTLNG